MQYLHVYVLIDADNVMSLQTGKGKTGGQDSNLTPAKLLLMHRERQMNMLSPHDGSSVHQMDIETGKTVAEWSFKKVSQFCTATRTDLSGCADKHRRPRRTGLMLL